MIVSRPLTKARQDGEQGRRRRELRGEGGGYRVRWELGGGHAGVLGEHLAEGEELLARAAGLIEGGVVVVGGDGGLVDALVVRAVGEAKVGAAVEHVDVHAGAGGEQVVEFLGGGCGGGGVVVSAPVVEPAAPELGAHERAGGLVTAERGEALGGAGAERTGLVQLGQAAVDEHLVFGLVDAGERDRDAGVLGDADELAQVVVIVGVCAVLVLDLDQDDGAAVADLQRGNDLVDALEVGGHVGHVLRLVAAHANGSVAEQPGGKAAVVPFGADVGAGAHDRVQAFFGNGAQEPVKVEAAVGDPGIGRGGVLIPGHVGLDGVEAHLAGLDDAIAPRVRMDAEVVQSAGEDAVRLTVEEEVSLADGEGGRARRRWRRQRSSSLGSLGS